MINKTALANLRGWHRVKIESNYSRWTLKLIGSMNEHQPRENFHLICASVWLLSSFMTSAVVLRVLRHSPAGAHRLWAVFQDQGAEEEVAWPVWNGHVSILAQWHNHCPNNWHVYVCVCLCLRVWYSKAERGVDTFICNVWSGLSCNQAHTVGKSMITLAYADKHTQT